MPRRLTFLFIVLLLAGIPGFSQIIIGPGGGYPGGGYPGGGYPGGGRRNPQQGGQQPGSGRNDDPAANNLTGILRKISDNSVVLESDDKDISTVSIANATKYADASGKSTHIGDFQPGDHVSIAGKKDKDGNYRASKMTMVREGTTDEHAAASQAMDDLSHPIQKGDSSNTSDSSSSSDDNRNRPKLRRASSSSDSGSSNSSSSSSSSDDDPDRPILRRPGSSSSGSSSRASNGSSNSASNSSGGDDDADRPILRRSAPASNSNSGSSSSQSQSSDSSNTVAAVRPSLHADDSGGVTRTPPPPQISENNDGSPHVVRSMHASSGDEVVDEAREAAFSFTETLPNYVVKQFTTRYQTSVARGGKTSWDVLDNVTADVIEENGVEKYKNILVNGKPPREDVEKTGSWSSGEFSSLELDVLSPQTAADFHGKRATTIVNRPAFRYDFSVDQPNSHWHVESETHSEFPAYTGSIWLDKETHRVLRIELSAQSLARSFPLDTVESAVDYDFVSIGDGKYLLPVHSEALSCARGTSQCSRNVIEFRNYRKFAADTSITFEADADK